jgi:transposase
MISAAMRTDADVVTDPQSPTGLAQAHFANFLSMSSRADSRYRNTLSSFHRARRPRMMVVLDDARYHHAVPLAPFLREHAAHLRLLFLPPYSPQLASIEHVWKLTRRLATHNRYFATLDEVLKAVNACFNRWRRPNPILYRPIGCALAHQLGILPQTPRTLNSSILSRWISTSLSYTSGCSNRTLRVSDPCHRFTIPAIEIPSVLAFFR